MGDGSTAVPIFVHVVGSGGREGVPPTNRFRTLYLQETGGEEELTQSSKCQLFFPSFLPPAQRFFFVKVNVL